MIIICTWPGLLSLSGHLPFFRYISLGHTDLWLLGKSHQSYQWSCFELFLIHPQRWICYQIQLILVAFFMKSWGSFQNSLTSLYQWSKKLPSKQDPYIESSPWGRGNLILGCHAGEQVQSRVWPSLPGGWLCRAEKPENFPTGCPSQPWCGTNVTTFHTMRTRALSVLIHPGKLLLILADHPTNSNGECLD